MDASTAFLILVALATTLKWLIKFIMRSPIQPNSHLDHGSVNKLATLDCDFCSHFSFFRLTHCFGYDFREELSVVESSASTSALAPYPPPLTQHDVFLSFRGEDTRDNFTSHLHDALCRAKIDTYIDNRLERGGEISPLLLKAIEESMISVIIFSENYASSTWCLDELVKILECKERDGRLVIPVFYNIDPSIVRKQSGSYGDAFLKHEKTFKGNKEKVKAWKDALFQAASLSGWDSAKTRPEATLVREIVKDISEKLNCMSSFNFEGLVGIHEHVEKMEGLLGIGSPDVHNRIVGIWGMGGIGKTTIADAVFHKHKAQFESSSFVAKVQEQLAAKNGQEELLKKCLKELLGEDLGTLSIRSNSVQTRLKSKKVLLVLDDVDNSIRADDLIKVSDLFGQGSRIIITSRDKHVLQNAGATKTYHVQGMKSRDSLQLFSLKAFEKDQPAKDYVELSERVVNYCNGLPLALTVLGSFLHGRSQKEWGSALAKLEKAPNQEIFNVLKVSFDGLDEAEKEIFLDLACFFCEGGGRPSVRLVSDCYDMPTDADINISVLKERSLISVDEGGFVSMHDLILTMGQQIGQQLGKNPGQPIRVLRKHEDTHRALRNDTGCEAIRCISLDLRETKKISLDPAKFRKLSNVRFLAFDTSYLEEPSILAFPGGLELPELRILRWEAYPQPSLPIRFCLENLVELTMSGSHLERLWDGEQHLPNLKIIDLNSCQQLIGLPDLSQAPKIETLNLIGCSRLVKVSSSRPLLNLSNLSLTGCSRMRRMEFALINCKKVEWEHCLLQFLPVSLCSKTLVELYLCYSNLKQLWEGDQHLPNLKIIDLNFCKQLIGLPDLSQAPKIETLKVNYCSRLVKISSSCPLLNLNELTLTGCCQLRSVEFASINCKKVEWQNCPLPSLPVSL